MAQGEGRIDGRVPGRGEGPAADDDERVPIFGTWPRIYTAVLITEALVMGLIAAFSAWRW